MDVKKDIGGIIGIAYAKNPATGIPGPVCCHGWIQSNVKNIQCTI